MDDTLKQHILGLALAGAEHNRLVFRKEHELIAGDPTARCYRKVTRPLREIEMDLTPSPYVATLYRCNCGEIPLSALWDAPAPVKSRHDPVLLNLGDWADGRGPHYHVWIGQCRECRTIWWRIQEA
jgi:hypothetical protein